MCTGLEIALVVGAVASAGTSAAQAAGAFGGGSAPQLDLPPLPTREDATAPATKEVEARRRRAGRAATQLTAAGYGLGNEPNIARPTLGA
jgi:hypothetical protein